MSVSASLVSPVVMCPDRADEQESESSGKKESRLRSLQTFRSISSAT